MSAARRGWWLGLSAGAVITVATMVDGPGGRPPPDAVAMVGQQIIRRADLDRALWALHVDRRGGVQPRDRARALDRLVTEALLVDWAIEGGLHRDDPRARLDLSTAALAAIAAEAERAPDEAELSAFLAEHAEQFRAPRALTVDHRIFTGPRARARARATRFAAGADEPGSDHPLAVPRAPMTFADLRQRLGPDAAEALWGGAPVAGPWRVPPDGWAVARRLADLGGEVPPLADVRAEVHEAWLRDQGERALRRFVTERSREVRVWRADR